MSLKERQLSALNITYSYHSSYETCKSVVNHILDEVEREIYVKHIDTDESIIEYSTKSFINSILDEIEHEESTFKEPKKEVDTATEIPPIPHIDIFAPKFIPQGTKEIKQLDRFDRAMTYETVPRNYDIAGPMPTGSSPGVISKPKDNVFGVGHTLTLKRKPRKPGSKSLGSSLTKDISDRRVSFAGPRPSSMVSTIDREGEVRQRVMSVIREKEGRQRRNAHQKLSKSASTSSSNHSSHERRRSDKVKVKGLSKQKVPVSVDFSTAPSKDSESTKGKEGLDKPDGLRHINKPKIPKHTTSSASSSPKSSSSSSNPLGATVKSFADIPLTEDTVHPAVGVSVVTSRGVLKGGPTKLTNRSLPSSGSASMAQSSIPGSQFINPKSMTMSQYLTMSSTSSDQFGGISGEEEEGRMIPGIGIVPLKHLKGKSEKEIEKKKAEEQEAEENKRKEEKEKERKMQKTREERLRREEESMRTFREFGTESLGRNKPHLPPHLSGTKAIHPGRSTMKQTNPRQPIPAIAERRKQKKPHIPFKKEIEKKKAEEQEAEEKKRKEEKEKERKMQKTREERLRREEESMRTFREFGTESLGRNKPHLPPHLSGTKAIHPGRSTMKQTNPRQPIPAIAERRKQKKPHIPFSELSRSQKLVSTTVTGDKTKEMGKMREVNRMARKRMGDESRGSLKRYVNEVRTLISEAPWAEHNKGSIRSQKYKFNYTVNNGFLFLTMTEISVADAIGLSFVEQISSEFHKSKFARIHYTRQLESAGFASVIESQQTKFDQSDTTKLRKIETELSSVHDIMVQNIKDVMGRGERLDSLEKMSADLMVHASGYAKSAQDLLHTPFWQQFGPSVVVGAIVIICLIIRFVIF
ncbi:putative multi-domain containing protein [Aduncisulcus paluster]|uniref:Multi-domain containing protein n=1 Tax=Aduncisulcus paluster TaxID=2918883 RepID=A0ABQ5KYI3_9EUKA|nr:putative multi-domain containing protein [Aduncisulcus paluster]